eukprot:GHVR01140736.1.p1 GENE.GHVR01140736.1~~GHVR01140736.1.p1  ORF type:complete len:133 (+),score=10.40 GHVR01140736.1:241-639(+)
MSILPDESRIEANIVVLAHTETETDIELNNQLNTELIPVVRQNKTLGHIHQRPSLKCFMRALILPCILHGLYDAGLDGSRVFSFLKLYSHYLVFLLITIVCYFTIIITFVVSFKRMVRIERKMRMMRGIYNN